MHVACNMIMYLFNLERFAEREGLHMIGKNDNVPWKNLLEIEDGSRAGLFYDKHVLSISNRELIQNCPQCLDSWKRTKKGNQQ